MSESVIFNDLLKVISHETKNSVDVSVCVSNKLYDILESNGLSFEDFAKNMGKSVDELEFLMQGTSPFTLEELADIGAILNDSTFCDCNKKGGC